MTLRYELNYTQIPKTGGINMEKHRAIPDGYMTIGQLAEKMDVTVRTLQYYDREGLLTPSAISEGGRRLYTDKDIIKLHQILSLKHLGFSLDDIKNRLIPLDSPEEVAAVLAEQADTTRAKIKNLTESLRELEALHDEVLKMKTVNFKKYADIIVNLEMKNDYYWLIKHFDDQLLDHIRGHFDRNSGLNFMDRFTQLQNEAMRLQDEGIPADSEEAQAFAEVYWNMITEFTGGDMSLLPKLVEFGQLDHGFSNAFIGSVLEIYFSRSGTNPFQTDNEVD